MAFGSGKSTTSTSSMSPMFQAMAGNLFGTAFPVLKELSSQTLEALKTGGVGAGLPIVNRAMDASRSAYSNSIEQIRQQLARTGLGGSSAGQAVLADETRRGAADIAGIPSQYAMNFISGAPQFGSVAGGAAGLGAGTGTRTTTPGFWDYFMQGLQSGSNIGAAYLLS